MTHLFEDELFVLNNPKTPLFNQETLDTIVGIIPVGTGKTANQPWFTAAALLFSEEIVSDRAAICRCDFIFEGNDAKISFTLDGTNYGFLEEGVTLKAGSLYTKEFAAENSTQFNIRANADVTIKKCVIVVQGKQELPE